MNRIDYSNIDDDIREELEKIDLSQIQLFIRHEIGGRLKFLNFRTSSKITNCYFRYKNGILVNIVYVNIHSKSAVNDWISVSQPVSFPKEV